MKRTRTLLKELTPVVEDILTTYSQTRDDDLLLYCYFLNTQGISRNISFWALRYKIKTRQLPSIESIGRIRRKIQEINPNLRPSDTSRNLRLEQEKEYKVYSQEV